MVKCSCPDKTQMTACWLITDNYRFNLILHRHQSHRNMKDVEFCWMRKWWIDFGGEEQCRSVDERKDRGQNRWPQGCREAEGQESCSRCSTALGVISGWDDADSQSPPTIPHTVYMWVCVCIWRYPSLRLFHSHARTYTNILSEYH